MSESERLIAEFEARGGKIQEIPIGVSSKFEPPREKKDGEARKNAHRTYHKNGGHHKTVNSKCASGYMNIIERPTCYSFVLDERTVHSIKYGFDKNKALDDIIKFRDEYRKSIGYPPAIY